MKRTLILILLLALLASAASAEVYTYDWLDVDVEYWNGWRDGYAVLLDADGAPLAPERTYALFRRVTPDDWPEDKAIYQALLHGVPESAAAYLDDEWYSDWDDSQSWTYRTAAFMDARGQLLTGFDYGYFTYFNETSGCVICTSEQGNYCQVDTSGRLLAAYLCDGLTPDGQGGFLMLREDVDADDTDVILRVDADGNVSPTGISGVEVRLSEMYGGLAAVQVYGDGEQTAWYVDAEGRPAFDRTWREAGSFENGYALVMESKDGGKGLIDASGAYVIPPVYGRYELSYDEELGRYVGKLADGLVIYNPEDDFRRRDISLEGCGDYQTNYIGAGLFTVEPEAGGTLLFDRDGNLLQRDDESYAYAFDIHQPSEGVAAVYPYRRERAYTLQDLSNGAALSDAYPSISFSLWKDGHGRYRCRLNGKSRRWGLLDETGALLLDAVYDDLEVLSLDRCWARQGDRQGMIDLEGNWLYAVSEYEFLID